MSVLRRVGGWLLLVTAGCASAPETPAPAPRAQLSRKVEAAPPAASAAAASARPQAAPPPFSFRDESPEGTAAWPAMEPEEAGFDPEKLKKVVESAKASQSSSLLVLKDGKMVVEQYFGQPRRPIQTMSMTKSIVSIAIGLLIAEKKIASVDVPLSKYFPEFAAGKKAKITLRHVLTHTSGLEHGEGSGKMEKEKDRLAYARARQVVTEPGATFSYSNEATQLLSGVVTKAAGKPVDEYLSERLFKPLSITDWTWARDEAGNVQTFYGLSLHARDLAKIGLLLANGGMFEEKEIVPAAWVRASTTTATPGSAHGYLWWLRLDKTGSQVGFAADGWLGQQLFVSPSLGLVMVRQHEAPKGVVTDGEYNKKVGHFSLRGEIEAAMLARRADTSPE